MVYPLPLELGVPLGAVLRLERRRDHRHHPFERCGVAVGGCSERFFDEMISRDVQRIRAVELVGDQTEAASFGLDTLVPAASPPVEWGRDEVGGGSGVVVSRRSGHCPG